MAMVGHLAVFTDRRSGNRVFTVWNNADKTQFVLVKNTPSGGTTGEPYQSDRMDTLIRDHLNDVWGNDDEIRVVKK